MLFAELIIEISYSKKGSGKCRHIKTFHIGRIFHINGQSGIYYNKTRRIYDLKSGIEHCGVLINNCLRSCYGRFILIQCQTFVFRKYIGKTIKLLGLILLQAAERHLLHERRHYYKTEDSKYRICYQQFNV